jgi:hypothetical protein
MAEKQIGKIMGLTQKKGGSGKSYVVGRSTNGKIFSKAFGSNGTVTIMDKAAFKRAAVRADRVLAENAAKRK